MNLPVLLQDSPNYRVNINIIQKTGATSAVILSYLVEKEAECLHKEGFFVISESTISEETGIPITNIDIGINILEDTRMITVAVESTEEELLIQFNETFIFEALNPQHTETSKPRNEKEMTEERKEKKEAKKRIERREQRKSKEEMVPKGTIYQDGQSRLAFSTEKQETKTLTKKVKPIFKVYPRIRKTLLPVTPEIREILDYWESKGLPVHREGTDVFATAVEHATYVMNGTLFNDMAQNKTWHHRKFTVNEIKSTIDHFYLRAHSPAYEPIGRKRKEYLQTHVRPCNFFYDPHVTLDEFKSQFLICLSKPIPAGETKKHLLKDLYPSCTKMMIAWYNREFGGTNPTIDNNKMNNFIAVGRDLQKFIETNKHLLLVDHEHMRIYGQYDLLLFLALQLTRCASKQLRESEGSRAKFKVWWLVSERMMEEQFPDFLREERFMR